MDTPEIAVARYAARISLWALYASGGALIVSACALVLELRRWFDEGVRLSVSIMANAKIVAGGRVDETSYVTATVTNRGNASTTLTRMCLFNYPMRFARLLPSHFIRWVRPFQPDFQALVTNTGAPAPLPFVLQPGHTWMGMATCTQDIKRMIEAGRLYVGIVGSHSDKPLLRRVRLWKPPNDAKV